MIRSCHSPTSASGLADRQVLIERRRAFNGLLIYSLILVEVVCSSITRNGPFICAGAGRVVAVPEFHDVVFD